MAQIIHITGTLSKIGGFSTTYRDFPITDALGWDTYWGPDEYKAWFNALVQKWGKPHARWKFQTTWDKNNLSASGSSFENYNAFNDWAASQGLKLSLGSAVTTAAGAWNFFTDIPNKIMTYGGIGLAAYGGLKFAANRKDSQKAKDVLSPESGLPFLLAGGALLGYKIYSGGLFSSAPPEEGKPKGQTTHGFLPFAETKPFFDYGILRLGQGNITSLGRDMWLKYKTLYPDVYRNYMTGNNLYTGRFRNDMYDIWACWNTGSLSSSQNAQIVLSTMGLTGWF